MDEIILLNRVRVDIGNVSGSLSELMQYATLKGFNDNYEPQEKPRLVGTWTINYWYTSEQLTQARNTFDGLTIIENNEFLIDFNNLAVQTLDSTQPNYNPAVAIILQSNNIGILLDSPVIDGQTGRWFMTQTQASSISNFNDTFKGKTTVSDVNGIVGVVGTSYNFTSFIEFKYFTGITLLSDGKTNFSNTSLLDSIEFPNTLNTLNTMWCSNSRLMTAGFNMKFPVTLSTIGGNAFKGVPFGTQINYFLTFYGLTPPNLSADNAFYSPPTKIYVPAEAVNSYKSAANWSTYASIIEAIPSN